MTRLALSAGFNIVFKVKMGLLFSSLIGIPFCLDSKDAKMFWDYLMPMYNDISLFGLADMLYCGQTWATLSYF